MIIYIVTSGEYSDYGINAVFTSKELAQQYITVYGIEDASIEEYEADLMQHELRHGQTIWLVNMWKDGETYRCEPYYTKETYTKVVKIGWASQRELMRTIVTAKDKQHAIKVANERRTRLIAENRWQLGEVLTPT